ncbi:hypothetical protein LCGC14_2599990, partial [marine sediment metagenome]
DNCLNNYFKSDTGNPIRLNLEFFIKLRNIVEHKSLPELDSNIFGEVVFFKKSIQPGKGNTRNSTGFFHISSGIVYQVLKI